jgi:hypothetical protein
MTKRTMLLMLVVEERSDSEPPMYDATDDEPSRIVQARPLPKLAKCGSELLELARKAGAL